MKSKLIWLRQQYRAALRKHLKQGPRAKLAAAQGLGRRAMSLGLETLDLATVHEQALVALVLPSYSPLTREGMVERAGCFFAEAITPIEKTHRTALETNACLDQANRSLRQRTLKLTASNRQLKQEIVKRRSAEQSLRKSERHSRQLLEQSWQMQSQLRLMSRQLLLVQEEERKKISRELHDVIAQTLTSINLRLADLKADAATNTKDLEQKITSTQQLVAQSVNIVHRFARELRPTVLDDVGLIPALHTFMQGFKEKTGIHLSLSAFAAVEQMKGDKRTVLYRVAQEALTNIARHAQASRAEVRIERLNGAVCMRIKDNGQGFQTEHALQHAKKSKRLGLLGMRERLEMVNGTFTIKSAPGKGTSVIAQIPFANGRRGSVMRPPPAKYLSAL